jgi:hypothetical protein
LLAEKLLGQGNEPGVECIHMPDAFPLFWVVLQAFANTGLAGDVR